MAKNKNKIISALQPLTPDSIINTKTGVYVSLKDFNTQVMKVIDTVVDETNKLYATHETVLLEKLTTYQGTPQPAEFARQQGFKTSFMTSLPRGVKALSRLEKLVQFKLVAEMSGFVNNPQANKQQHTFSQSVNLGAVDKQMVSISTEGNELFLLWKCWNEEYYITFTIPSYVLNRNIEKFTLPVVKLNKQTLSPEFMFNIVQTPKPRKGFKHQVGVDLGQKIPYSMVVVNSSGSCVAKYETTPRLTRLTRKRERLHLEVAHIRQKINNRATRGLESPLQELELELTRSKATRLTKTVTWQTGAEISRKLAKHNSNLILVENLTWVSGTKKSKIGNSKWFHSKTQEAIKYSTSKIGYTTKKINADGTSQTCHKCGEAISHKKNRSVWCQTCKTSLDRDFNAAMNIAKRSPFPAGKKPTGGTTSNSGAANEQRSALGTVTKTLPAMVRKVT